MPRRIGQPNGNSIRKADRRVVGRLVRHDLGDLEEAHILVMGDLHVGDAHCDLDMIRQGVAWVTEDINRYCVIVGDLFNAALKDSVSDVYSEAMSVKDSRHMLVKLLSPLRGRCLSVVSGNHDHRIHKAIGDDICEVTCTEAGLPYHMGQAFLDISLGNYRNTSKLQPRHPVHYAMYITHGWGGGRMVGGKANNLLRLAEIVSADLYASGHCHTPIVIPQTVWEFDVRSCAVIERERLFVATGASLDRGDGYGVRFGFPALPKVWPIVTLDGGAKHMQGVC